MSAMSAIRPAMWAAVFGLWCAGTAAHAACEKGYVATFRIKPGTDAAFETQLLALVAKVRANEPGNLLYQPYRGAGIGEYVVLERYVDAAARDAHGDSPAIKEAFPKLLPLLRDAPSIAAISALECTSK